MPHILDGKQISLTLREQLQQSIQAFTSHRGYAPGLAVILVGDNPASQMYVANKIKACQAIGIRSFVYTFEKDTPQATLEVLIDQLNTDPSVHGILLQLPLPPGLQATQLTNRIRADKDVDGLTYHNLGALTAGSPQMVPCTPLGCLHVIQSVQPDVTGARALVIGRSQLVGKPMALLLTLHNATVTLAHSKTRGLEDLCQEADILIVAIGCPRFIPGRWIRPGAIVIDVGINRLPSQELCGDVNFEEAYPIAGAITPVPRGIGPMTIAYLLYNTLKAAQNQ